MRALFCCHAAASHGASVLLLRQYRDALRRAPCRRFERRVLPLPQYVAALIFAAS